MKSNICSPFSMLFVAAMMRLADVGVAQEISIPDPGLNGAIRDTLQKPAGPLTVQDMLGLTRLDASSRNVSRVDGLEAARNLSELRLDNNSLTNFPIVSALTNLVTLNLFNNHLTSFVLISPSPKLTVLDLGFNTLTQCFLPRGLTNLDTLFLEGNRLTAFTVPGGLTALTKLDLAANALTTFTLPRDATNLANLLLFANQITNVVLPAGLSRLNGLLLDFNHLPGLILPSGLTSLTRLSLLNNQLTSLTLPPDVTALSTLFVDGNPLVSFVLSEPAAVTNLAELVTTLRNQGVSVIAYPIAVRLTFPSQQPIGAFRMGITGPPGVYGVLASTNFASWSVLSVVSNPVGSMLFADVTANLSPRKFYQAGLLSPANMIFIPPNTFTMGSPTNELHRLSNEGPQTVVTLAHGFWIGKYEVTQGDYLSVMNTNPSQFPGDLSRPVSDVSWVDATNYCWRLTQRELAAGRLLPGSEYRLPTEAEWECAARAGTSTRFSHGDDPDYGELPNYAWQSLDDGLTVHPVGLKLPNPWGLYDMAGNVFEWCQDWLGPLPGGAVTDPQGPPSNAIGWKVMRGGAFDFGGSACRSASRSFFGNHPALTDWNLGFRVVLTTGAK